MVAICLLGATTDTGHYWAVKNVGEDRRLSFSDDVVSTMWSAVCDD